MQGIEDLKNIRFSIECGITIDLERIQEDPIWRNRFSHLGDEGLSGYLSYYLNQDTSLLSEMPSTCGPAEIFGMFSAKVFDVKVPEEKNRETA